MLPLPEVEAELHELPAHLRRVKTAVEHRPSSHDFDRIVRAPARVMVGGEPAIVALPAPESYRSLLAQLRLVKHGEWRKTDRSSGLASKASMTIGFLPRVPFRQDFCYPCVLNRTHPELAAAVFAAARDASAAFAEYAPKRFETHCEQLEAVRSEWRIPDSAYTSGIANKNNPLAYHLDAGNFHGSWSAMYAMQRGVRGGELVVPALRLAFDFGEQPTLIMFDGQSLMHGVAPFSLTGPTEYRYTMVLYALAGLRQCGSPEEELARVRVRKTDAERARTDPEEVERRRHGRRKG